METEAKRRRKKGIQGEGKEGGGIETDADSGTFCGMWVDWEKLGLAEWRRRRRRTAIPSLLSTPADGCRIIEPPTLIRGIEEGEGERGKTGPSFVSQQRVGGGFKWNGKGSHFHTTALIEKHNMYPLGVFHWEDTFFGPNFPSECV